MHPQHLEIRNLFTIGGTLASMTFASVLFGSVFAGDAPVVSSGSVCLNS